jgi:hypothetical protein
MILASLSFFLMLNHIHSVVDGGVTKFVISQFVSEADNAAVANPGQRQSPSQGQAESKFKLKIPFKVPSNQIVNVGQFCDAFKGPHCSNYLQCFNNSCLPIIQKIESPSQTSNTNSTTILYESTGNNNTVTSCKDYQSAVCGIGLQCIENLCEDLKCPSLNETSFNGVCQPLPRFNELCGVDFIINQCDNGLHCISNKCTMIIF